MKARTWDVLEAWDGNSGAAPYGWTVSNSAKFDIEDGSAAVTSPIGGATVLLNTKTNPNNSPITENISAESLPSNTIGVMVWNTNLPSQIQFQLGIGAAAEFVFSLDAPSKETWTALLWDIGSIGTINYKRFNVVENSGAADTYLSKLLLPGRLQGEYRYVYTHYDPTLKRESEPSDISNGGTPIDVSALAGTAALQKSIGVNFTSDSGSDSSTTKIRIYRSGGSPQLTQENGIDIWCRVGEVLDFSTQVDGNHTAGDTTIVLDSVTGLAAGDWLIFEKGTVGSEEYGRITNVNSGTRTVTLSQGIAFNHNDNAAVQMAFVDNVPNAQVDTLARIDLERDDPPSAAKWVAKLPDGRLGLATDTAIYISNRATPERPVDYEVFPLVDPVTRQSPLQGFYFLHGGAANDETIQWFGVYNDRPFYATRRHFYEITGTSQDTFGAYGVVKVHSVGCINGDTVAEVDGWLYWVSDGPRVFRWAGSGPPEDISHLLVNERLKAAPVEFWRHWFAVTHAEEGGRYYSLYYVDDETLDAPTNLTATAVSASQIDLTWADAEMDELGFAIERSTDNVIFTQIATVAADVTSYSATGLSALTTYYFRVRAFEGVGTVYSDYSSVASDTTLVTPTDLPNLILYLNADTTFSGASHGDPVDSWTDLSGNAYHMIGSGGTRPEVQVSSNLSPNSKVLVRFDGTDDILNRSTPNPWPSGAAGHTIYVYGRLKSSASFALLWTDETVNRPQVGYEKNVNSLPYVRTEADGTAVKDLHNANIFDTKMQLFCVVFKANGTVQAYRAISSGALTALSENPTYTLNGAETGIAIGGSVVSGNGFCTMDLASVIWYNTEHDTTTIEGIRTYLRTLFGED